MFIIIINRAKRLLKKNLANTNKIINSNVRNFIKILTKIMKIIVVIYAIQRLDPLISLSTLLSLLPKNTESEYGEYKY